MKNWIIAAVAVAVLFVVLFLSDRPAQTPSGLDIIRNNAQYVEANNKAATLALSVLQKAEAGGVLTDEDKGKLREAIKYLEAMNIYEPRHVNSYVGAGKCYLYIGEKEKAGERLGQAILNKDLDPAKDTQEVQLSVIEAMALLSQIDLDLAVEEIANANSATQANDPAGAEAAKKRSTIYMDKALEFANQTLKAAPTGFRYLVNRANIYLAKGKKDLAKADLVKAKTLAPNDPKVLQSAKLIGL